MYFREYFCSFLSKSYYFYILGVSHLKAITWANIDPDLCYHMPSLGHNELISCLLMTWQQKEPRHQQSWYCLEYPSLSFNTLRPTRNEQHFADDIFKRIFFNENVWVPIKISLKFVPNVPINNIPALVQIMAWRRSGGKPLSEPMMVSLSTHICVTRPQWVKGVVDWLFIHKDKYFHIFDLIWFDIYLPSCL